VTAGRCRAFASMLIVRASPTRRWLRAADSSTPEPFPQLQNKLASLDLELSAEQWKSLDEASRIDLGFPQHLYEKKMVRAIRHGGVWDRLLL
jgi:hypothetical protein